MLVSLISITVITALQGKRKATLSSEGNLAVFSVSSSPDASCIASAFVISHIFLPPFLLCVFLSVAVQPPSPPTHPAAPH